MEYISITLKKIIFTITFALLMSGAPSYAYLPPMPEPPVGHEISTEDTKIILQYGSQELQIPRSYLRKGVIEPYDLNRIGIPIAFTLPELKSLGQKFKLANKLFPSNKKKFISKNGQEKFLIHDKSGKPVSQIIFHTVQLHSLSHIPAQRASYRKKVAEYKICEASYNERRQNYMQDCKSKKTPGALTLSCLPLAPCQLASPFPLITALDHKSNKVIWITKDLVAIRGKSTTGFSKEIKADLKKLLKSFIHESLL
ncbi:MAG: hypothetical protein P8P30_02050 [Rickettsiales bacterium]|nr:hypothetical protein [Rickettsiales bacterium]